MIEAGLGRLVAGLRAAGTFEAACEPLYDVVKDALEERLGARGAQVVRVVVHQIGRAHV